MNKVTINQMLFLTKRRLAIMKILGISKEFILQQRFNFLIYKGVSIL